MNRRPGPAFIFRYAFLALADRKLVTALCLLTTALAALTLYVAGGTAAGVYAAQEAVARQENLTEVIATAGDLQDPALRFTPDTVARLWSLPGVVYAGDLVEVPVEAGLGDGATRLITLRGADAGEPCFEGLEAGCAPSIGRAEAAVPAALFRELSGPEGGPVSGGATAGLRLHLAREREGRRETLRLAFEVTGILAGGGHEETVLVSRDIVRSLDDWAAGRVAAYAPPPEPVPAAAAGGDREGNAVEIVVEDRDAGRVRERMEGLGWTEAKVRIPDAASPGSVEPHGGSDPRRQAWRGPARKHARPRAVRRFLFRPEDGGPAAVPPVGDFIDEGLAVRSWRRLLVVDGSSDGVPVTLVAASDAPAGPDLACGSGATPPVSGRGIVLPGRFLARSGGDSPLETILGGEVAIGFRRAAPGRGSADEEIQICFDMIDVTAGAEARISIALALDIADWIAGRTDWDGERFVPAAGPVTGLRPPRGVLYAGSTDLVPALCASLRGMGYRTTDNLAAEEGLSTLAALLTVMVIILVGGFVISAIANILVCSVQDVRQRVHEIGILLSFGTGRGLIAGIFLAQGFLLGAGGFVLGIAGGCLAIEPFQRLLSDQFGLPAEAGLGPRELLTAAWWLLPAILAVTVFSALAGTAGSAYFAARLSPVEAFRHRL